MGRFAAKNGEVFKIVRENVEVSYKVPFDGIIYNLKQFGDLAEIPFPGIELLKPFLQYVELEVLQGEPRTGTRVRLRSCPGCTMQNPD
jgi:hypothetical protein